MRARVCICIHVYIFYML